MSAVFPTNIITIEGPDLSGKTTLYQGIHKKTKFKWNIQDRSFLSMLCYAKLYGRPQEEHRKGLEREIHNLNNRIIVVLPPLSALQERLKKRGDDFQDSQSIVKLWSIFSEEAEIIQDYPNVAVIRSLLSPSAMVDKCVDFVQRVEAVTSSVAGKNFKKAIHANRSDSATLDARLVISSNEDHSMIMNHPREGAYYRQILNDTCEIIEKEKSGDNPYNTPQTNQSRRFYYSSSSCISGIHFLVRDNVLVVLASLRSTDVDRNASIDTNFLCHLSICIAKKLDCRINKIELNARLNCAHVRKDLPAWNKQEEEE